MEDRHLIVAGLIIGLLTMLMVAELSKDTFGKDEVFLIVGFGAGATAMWAIRKGKGPK